MLKHCALCDECIQSNVNYVKEKQIERVRETEHARQGNVLFYG